MPDLTIVQLVHIQLASLIILSTLALVVVLSPDRSRGEVRPIRYSRYLILTSLLFLVAQYAVQIAFGFRQRSEMLGALCNILFYLPAANCISLSILTIFNYGRPPLANRLVAVLTPLFNALLCLGVYLACGSVEKSYLVVICSAVYGLTSIYNIRCVTVHYRKIRKGLDNFFSFEARPMFSWFLHAYYVIALLGVASSIFVFETTIVFIGAPIMLLIIVFFVSRFVGFQYTATQYMRSMEHDASTTRSSATENDNSNALGQDEVQRIGRLLDDWIGQKQYLKFDLTLDDLADSTKLSKRKISMYINNIHQQNFKTWLNLLRVEEAKRMIKEQPLYSIDSVSEVCGFSSRNYFHRVFKDATGMTPAQWRDKAGE